MSNKNSLVKLTEKHNGKMSGIQSLSTAVTCNGHCQKNKQVKGSICEKCYSDSMCKRYSNLNKMLVDNYNILTSRLLTFEELPLVNVIYFRFEAFGDLDNGIQFMNYINICNVNPDTHFAIWTKNPEIMHSVFKGGLIKKPENLKIIVSSLMLNEIRNVEKYKYFVDHVFTVYTLDYIIEHPEIKINCGSRSCFKCHQCYKHNANECFYISELLKADHKKAVKLGIKIG